MTSRRDQLKGITLAALCVPVVLVAALVPAALYGGRKTAQGWEVFAIAYPDDRDVTVTLGGGEKTLTARGECKVRWRENIASLELEVEGLPAPAQAGWTGSQYVLWAIDSEKKIVNLGSVPLNSDEAEWTAQAPFRIFGLLVTAETDPQASSPSSAVALESLLPTDPKLVVPVFRVPLTFAP
jgi:hypothetical protein